MNESLLIEVVSGKRRGVGARCLRLGLGWLSAGYGLGVSLRNRAFDLGLRRSCRAAVPVVSIGNVTTGGTGKTPFVAYLADWFRRRGVAVALLSRGYRRLAGGVNDEKLVLDRLLPGVPHWQHPDRVACAAHAVAQGAQLLLLDDGFQHRRLARDLDLVLIDGLNPWGYGHLLPRGLLREPLSALRRADLVVVTRADHASEGMLGQIRARLVQIRGTADCVEVGFPAVRLVSASGTSNSISSAAGRAVIAFCGIGNPAGFRRMLSAHTLNVRAFRTFADHHHYTPADLAELAELMEDAGASAVLTTLKDLVKINRDELAGRPLWAVHIETQILAGGGLLEGRLQELVAAAHRTPAS